MRYPPLGSNRRSYRYARYPQTRSRSTARTLASLWQAREGSGHNVALEILTSATFTLHAPGPACHSLPAVSSLLCLALFLALLVLSTHLPALASGLQRSRFPRPAPSLSQQQLCPNLMRPSALPLPYPDHNDDKIQKKGGAFQGPSALSSFSSSSPPVARSLHNAKSRRNPTRAAPNIRSTSCPPDHKLMDG